MEKAMEKRAARGKAEKNMECREKVQKGTEVLFTKQGFRVKIHTGLNRMRRQSILQTFSYAYGDWQMIILEVFIYG